MTRPLRLFTLRNIAVALIVFVSASMVALGFAIGSSLMPAGSSELRLRAVTPWEARLTYQLPRGQTWTSIYERLKGEGWTIYDDGPRVLWPDLMDDSRTSADFWRHGWFNLFQQWLTVRRVSDKPPVFVVEAIQCARYMPAGACH